MMIFMTATAIVPAVQPKQAAITSGPALATFIKKGSGLPFAESLMKASAEGRVAASNKALDGVLVGSEAWKPLAEQGAFTSWTGTMACYVEPGIAFNKSSIFSGKDNAIVYTDPGSGQKWVFPIPEAYANASGAILVVEHPHYSLSMADNCVQVRIIGLPDILFGLPAKNGWYSTEPVHGIPAGGETDRANQYARFLSRKPDGRVGPAARSCGNNNLNGRDVYLDFWPSTEFGLIVETP